MRIKIGTGRFAQKYQHRKDSTERTAKKDIMENYERMDSHSVCAHGQHARMQRQALRPLPSIHYGPPVFLAWIRPVPGN